MPPHHTVLRSRDCTGHVLLDWEPVAGALGYLVHRADQYEGPYAPLHVTGVPRPPYADTHVEAGHGYWYRIAPWTARGTQPPLPDTVRGCALARGSRPAAVRVAVDVGDPRAVHVTGDGARALVKATADRREGAFEVLLVNTAPDRTGSAPVPLLERHATVEVSGLEPGARYRVHAGDPAREHNLRVGDDGVVHTSLVLPMPGVRTLRLTRA
ncbi:MULTISPECIES: hypothetical protein [unclassified Streptomyces]|uniref:hypothetical protein n=1 Tax=unclassified Streptomyces TaxID=2593676 RepID=UPI000CD52D6E|nr:MULTISPECIES: hypothetical protein [unclassified Streptomyces]RPK49127.1 hypothetical protein EES40_08045 [Streptomyces sp. ADI93-02]